MTITCRIRNLGCASCAAKMERKIARLPGVKAVRVNFLSQRLTLEADEARMQALCQEAASIVSTIERDARLELPA